MEEIQDNVYKISYTSLVAQIIALTVFVASILFVFKSVFEIFGANFISWSDLGITSLSTLVGSSLGLVSTSTLEMRMSSEAFWVKKLIMTRSIKFKNIYGISIWERPDGSISLIYLQILGEDDSYIKNVERMGDLLNTLRSHSNPNVAFSRCKYKINWDTPYLLILFLLLIALLVRVLTLAFLG